MTQLRRIVVFFALLMFPVVNLPAWKIEYAEQFYKLYHKHMYSYPEESAENLWYLSMALRSPFANPLNALAKIENELEWAKYRNLFSMHLHLRIINEYLNLAAKYDKFNAYFYNYPWKSANLDSLKIAEAYYKLALESWEAARLYGETAREQRFRWFHLDEIQFWEDEAFRIENGELDYGDIIAVHLARLEQVRSEFASMDYDTY
ncbi:FIG00434455: hypothetical protein [Olavius algarvensis spirochete endosymbiont]|uniref:hypothetical protein n=1 Tax=Olavius algarvensis spirochete endosymbiont TaxID=260710 RepID=UPI00052BC366|nr:hypothetical protein [Olavius algarvensis spirochete endosymbiont]KGM44381.1 hypothetical protein JY97_01055 [Alkalispirochaeta odontotermitis]CAD7837653.1 MAG: hypothetical protein [Olavius algarvensis spirochete endosymbiont]VDA99834.1 FIG00434455: hypothetical protein [Olavius algarvensis spirochete endosymbiont]